MTDLASNLDVRPCPSAEDSSVSDSEPLNTNESANIDVSSTSLNATYSNCSFLPWDGVPSQPISYPPPPLFQTPLGPTTTYVTIGTVPPGVAPLPYLPLPVRPLPPSNGLHLSMLPSRVGSMATPVLAVLPGSAYSSYTNMSSSSFCSQVGPSPSLPPPMFFSPEEGARFQMSSSSCSSDANLAISQVTLGGSQSLLSTNQLSPIFHPVRAVPSMTASFPPPGGAMLAPPVVSGPVYPTVYVSPAGLLTVLMKDDIAVEMTLDRAIRVVNHSHKAVAATNGRGNASCIHHDAAKIYQDRTTTQLELYDERRARMMTDDVVFGLGSGAVPIPTTPLSSSYRVTPHGISSTENPEFSDLSKDMSVTMLFSSSGYGPHLMAQYEEVAQASRYRFYRNGAVTVYINGVRVHQFTHGDVIVVSGRKYLRVSPKSGLARVVTHFVEMTVEQNWTVRIRRGGHRLLASSKLFLMSNDKVEFGLNMFRQPFLRPLSEKLQTIICRQSSRKNSKVPVESWKDDDIANLSPGSSGKDRYRSKAAFIDAQSSDSRLLAQCMASPGYSGTDWATDSTSATTNCPIMVTSWASTADESSYDYKLEVANSETDQAESINGLSQ